MHQLMHQDAAEVLFNRTGFIEKDKVKKGKGGAGVLHKDNSGAVDVLGFISPCQGDKLSQPEDEADQQEQGDRNIDEAQDIRGCQGFSRPLRGIAEILRADDDLFPPEWGCDGNQR